MAKFKESELTENLKDFQNKCEIELEFEKSISGKLKIEDATIFYNNKTGFINIDSEKAKFKINTTLVYRYERIKDVIYIELEMLLLKIRKLNNPEV